ncbi:hypothetical protein KSX_70800 [Ktedonospora formicarum]|uniref:Uncharacterized protein n=1 Tax=Ktedonospora formicarum TaxID=2778364 RepID=A0A8J3I2K2_9CHLR|nr:hypothetical protein KSX_70800 [Ktedonospora formicarum]
MACFAQAEAATRASIRLLAGGAALGATTWGIGQSTARVKFLLADSKGKLLIAIAAIQYLISQKELSFSALRSE